MSRGARPPRLAEGLLTAVIGGDARGEGVLGDLHEEFLREGGNGATPCRTLVLDQLASPLGALHRSERTRDGP